MAPKGGQRKGKSEYPEGLYGGQHNAPIISRYFVRYTASQGASVGREQPQPDQREDQPEGYTRHEVAAPRVVAPRGSAP